MTGEQSSQRTDDLEAAWRDGTPVFVASCRPQYEVLRLANELHDALSAICERREREHDGWWNGLVFDEHQHAIGVLRRFREAYRPDLLPADSEVQP